jgi:2-amino-4-hydroxy-6-hydroxymethyldihydropteridine diphosphokinase
MPGIFLSLGSNLGNRAANIAMALRMLAPLVRVEGVSRLYESAPADGSDQPLYYNAAARVVTGLGPDLLLAHLKHVERLIGRRPSPRWSPRPIDIDIVLFDDVVLRGEELSIPHPRLAERSFVLRPLLDLDPGLTLPGSGQRLAELRAASEPLTVVAEGEWWRDARKVGVPMPAATLARPSDAS